MSANLGDADSMEPKKRADDHTACEALPLADSGLRPTRLSPWRMFASVLVAAVIVWVLLRVTDVSISQVLETLRRTSPAAVLIGLGLHMATYGLRSLRLRFLLHSKRVPVRRLFEFTTVHYLFNHVLPLRAGEFTLVYLLRQREGVPVAEGLGILVIARVLDLIAFTLFYPAAILALDASRFPFPAYVQEILWAVAGLFLALTALLVAVSFRGRALIERMRRLLLRGILGRSRFLEAFFRKLDEVGRTFEHLRSWPVVLGSFVLSLTILGLVYLIGYVLLAGMGYPMAFPLIILCSTLANLGFILPLYSFGGFGTLEAGWTVGCLMAGFSKEMGMASGFSFHVLVLCYVSVMGVYGLFRVGQADRTVRRAPCVAARRGRWKPGPS